MNFTDALKTAVLGVFGLNSLLNNDNSSVPGAVINMTNVTSLPLDDQFFVTPELHLQRREVCRTSGADVDAPFDVYFPELTEIRYTQKFSPVFIPGYIILTVGPQGLDPIQKPFTVISDSLYYSPEQKSKITVRRLENKGFVGSEFVAVDYDFLDDASEIAAVDSNNYIIASLRSGANRKNNPPLPNLTISNFKRTFNLFGSLLALLRIRYPLIPLIVYGGDISNKEVYSLISTVNKTVPVFTHENTASEYIRRHYFNKTIPQYELDSIGVPIGQQSEMKNINLKPFTCTDSMPIHGVSNLTNDYGATWGRVYTNRWWFIQLSALKNGSLVNFTITFKDDSLVVMANTDSQDIIESIDGKPLASINGSISFPYKRNAYQGSYYTIKSSDYKGAVTLSIEAYKKNKKDASTLASFRLYGQPRGLKLCSFAPFDKDGVAGAETKIEKAKSTYINTGFKPRQALA